MFWENKMKRFIFGDIYNYQEFYFRGRRYWKVPHHTNNKHGNTMLLTPRVINGKKQTERNPVYVTLYDGVVVWRDEE